MKIKDIAVSERPRERLVCNSVNSLSDAELLAVILQNGSYGERDFAVLSAKRVTSDFHP